MKQPQYSPLSVSEQALTLFSVNKGYYDDVPVEKALVVRIGAAPVHEGQVRGDRGQDCYRPTT